MGVLLVGVLLVGVLLVRCVVSMSVVSGCVDRRVSGMSVFSGMRGCVLKGVCESV